MVISKNKMLIDRLVAFVARVENKTGQSVGRRANDVYFIFTLIAHQCDEGRFLKILSYFGTFHVA